MVAQYTYPTDITDEEAAAGFQLVESATGVRAIVLPVAVGLRAIKVTLADGSIEYTICDENCRPLYAGARTLAELKGRFGAK